jgi:glycosyltransferase involved in cell wall biosynthesis
LNSPLVSVCVATFNQDRYIEDCLVSVLMQMHDAPLEILIGDDGIAEHTPHIVERLRTLHPGVIRYFRHAVNLGPSANYQFLVHAARGAYIAHLDGDDFWLPGKLRAQLQWFQDHPGSAACYTNAVLVSDDRRVRGSFSSEVQSPVGLEFLLERGNFLNHSSMLYRAEYRGVVLNLAGPFIDYRMHLNFAKIAPLGFLEAAYVAYRLDSEHSMIRKTPGLVQELYFEGMTTVLSDATVSHAVRRRALRFFWGAIVMEALAHGRLVWAKDWFRKISKLYPADAWSVLPPGFLQAFQGLAALALSRTWRRLFHAGNLRVLHER